MTPDTRASRPFQRQPRPRAADTISSSAGKYATPTTGSPIDLERDEHAVERHAADERVGAVDRIDDPAVARVAIVAAEFLADDGVIGKARVDETPQQLFRLAIGDRHRRPIGLALDRDAGLIVRERQTARLPRGVDRRSRG